MIRIEEKMNKLERLFSEPQSGKDYARRYASYISELLSDFDFQAIEKVIEIFEIARSKERIVFFIGNGGSAATCLHFAEDLSYGTMVEGKKPFKALSLTDNSAYTTALANDEGYENIFVGQMRALFSAGDVLVAISSSGNSPNLVKAIEYANNKGGNTIGIVGFDGGKLKSICHHCVHIKTMEGEYGPVEDLHLILAHIISTFLMFKLRE